MIEDLIKLLKSLIAGKFYGVLVIKFEAGRIVMIEKTEKIKP